MSEKLNFNKHIQQMIKTNIFEDSIKADTYIEMVSMDDPETGAYIFEFYSKVTTVDPNDAQARKEIFAEYNIKGKLQNVGRNRKIN